MTDPSSLEDAATKGLWNRRRDLRCVRRHLDVDGRGGDPDAEVRCARTGALLSRGYERVLLGDHGPYFELDRDRVVWSNLRLVPGGAARFYDEWRVAAPKPSLGDDDPDPDPDPTKLYDQLRPVTGQCNPPRDSAWAGEQPPRVRGVRRVPPGSRLPRRAPRIRRWPRHAPASRRRARRVVETVRATRRHHPRRRRRRSKPSDRTHHRRRDYRARRPTRRRRGCACSGRGGMVRRRRGAGPARARGKRRRRG